MSINFGELRELLGTISQTNITELILKSEDFELTVRMGKTTTVIPAVSVPEVVVSSNEPPVTTIQVPATPTQIIREESAPSPVEKNWVPITSPMVGTFYRAPAPDEQPFVEVGERIRDGQTVCIIEAMKLMNEIEAEVSGFVMEIAVANGEPVEYGQTLMWIKPD